MKGLPKARLTVMLGLVITVMLGACAKPAATLPPPAPTTPVTTAKPAPTTAKPAPSPSPTPAPAPKPTPAPTPSPTGPYGELRIGEIAFGAETWDPIAGDATASSVVASPVLGWMLSMEKGKVVPGIIEKWEPAADGLSWIYHVRRGVKFSNGDTLTAKDIKFSLDRYINKDARMAELRNAVDRVEVVDDYTVRIFTKGPQPFVPNYTIPNAPATGLVTPMDYFQKVGLEGFLKNPIGAGPWKLVKHVKGDSIEYEVNPNYWGKPPAFQKLTIMQVPEATTRIAMLKTGQVDVIPITLEDVQPLEQAGFKAYQLSGVAPRLQFIGTYDPRAKGMPAADIRVRQALNLAIDRDEISKTLFFDKTAPIMPPQVFYGQEDVDSDYWVKYVKETVPYDPVKAKQLLADAGYPNGFSIKLYVIPVAGAAWMPNLCQVISAYWQKIGVKAELVTMDPGTYVAWLKGPNAGFVGQALVGTLGAIAPVGKNLSNPFSNTGLTRLMGGDNGVDYMPELTKLVGATLSTVDKMKRQEAIDKAIKMAMDTWTATAFGEVPGYMAVGPKVKFDIPQPPSQRYIPQYIDYARHAP